MTAFLRASDGSLPLRLTEKIWAWTLHTSPTEVGNMPVGGVSFFSAAAFFCAVLAIALAIAILHACRERPLPWRRAPHAAPARRDGEARTEIGLADLYSCGTVSVLGQMRFAKVAGALRLSASIEGAAPGAYLLRLGGVPSAGPPAPARGRAVAAILPARTAPLRDLGQVIAGADGRGALTLFFLPSAFPQEEAHGWRGLAGRTVEVHTEGGGLVATGIVRLKSPSPAN
jgi:hypothetical protein